MKKIYRTKHPGYRLLIFDELQRLRCRSITPSSFCGSSCIHSSFLTSAFSASPLPSYDSSFFFPLLPLLCVSFNVCSTASVLHPLPPSFSPPLHPTVHLFLLSTPLCPFSHSISIPIAPSHLPLSLPSISLPLYHLRLPCHFQKVSWESKNIVFFPSFTPRYWSNYSCPTSDTAPVTTGTSEATDGYTVPVSFGCASSNT